jgi:hypothetical protein
MSRNRANLAYLLSIAGAIAAKFWLIQSEEIFGSWTEYDALWYLKSTSNWYWNAPYSWDAFFRTPGHPLFIATVHTLGIPLRIGIEIFQISGYLLIIYALRWLRYPRWFCCVVFAVSLFNPSSFQVNNLAYSDTAYAGALVWLVGAMMLTLARGTIRSALPSGGMFAFAWITREETFLLLPIFALFVCSLVVRELRGTSSLKAALRQSQPQLLAFVAAGLGLIAVVYFSNSRRFGSFSNSEMSSPAFRAAYRALARIKPPHVIRYVPVTHESLQLAYATSPTFAQLQPALEGPIAAGWKQLTAKELRCCEGEIGGAWLRFALRYVADQAGFHRDAQTAQQFTAISHANSITPLTKGAFPGDMFSPLSLIRARFRSFARYPVLFNACFQSFSSVIRFPQSEKKTFFRLSVSSYTIKCVCAAPASLTLQL